MCRLGEISTRAYAASLSREAADFTGARDPPTLRSLGCDRESTRVVGNSGDYDASHGVYVYVPSRVCSHGLRCFRRTGSTRSHAGTFSSEIFHYLDIVDGSAAVNDSKDEDTQKHQHER